MFISMWDEEKEKRKKIRRKALKKAKKGRIMDFGGINPGSLLLKGGYKLFRNGSYVKNINSKVRFHAYIISDTQVEVHKDTVESNKVGVWHKASDDGVPKELRRLRHFVPSPEKNTIIVSLSQQEMADIFKKMREEKK